MDLHKGVQLLIKTAQDLAQDLDSNHPILNLSTDTCGLGSPPLLKVLIRQINTDGELAGYSAPLSRFKSPPLCHVILSWGVFPQEGYRDTQSICDISNMGSQE